jgi:AraC family transcriptional regulator
MISLLRDAAVYTNVEQSVCQQIDGIPPTLFSLIANREKKMNQHSLPEIIRSGIGSTARRQNPLLELHEAMAPKGAWATPAVNDVSVALALSNFSARWRDSRVLRSEAIAAGTVSICTFGESKTIEMKDAAGFAIVVVRNEALELVIEEARPQIGAGLEAHDALHEPTLNNLIQVLLIEKREGFPNDLFFLDGLAVALAGYLIRQYSSVSPHRRKTFTGGLAPSALRRSIEVMEAHIDKELRLSELAREAGMSVSHFIRGFRQSTGKSPHQFLIHRRVERAQALMRDPRISLTEVALASGFADQHHLARVFRRITNVTPSSYRRSL